MPLGLASGGNHSLEVSGGATRLGLWPEGGKGQLLALSEVSEAREQAG